MRGRGTAIRVRQGRQDAGFTLVELLVAFVILGLIMVALAGGINFGTRAWEASARRSADIEEVVGVQSFLRRQISRAVLTVDEESATGAGTDFVGTTDNLRFAAPWLSPVGAGGIYVFDLSVEAAGSGRDLKLQWALRHPEWSGTFDPQSRNQRVLMKDISGLRIRYLGDTEREDTAWASVWEDPLFLPRLIEIDVELSRGDSRVWPPLIIAPQALSLGQ